MRRWSRWRGTQNVDRRKKRRREGDRGVEMWQEAEEEEKSAVSRLLYLAALRRPQRSWRALRLHEASGGYCVRNRATFIHAPSRSLLSLLPSDRLATTIFATREEVYAGGTGWSGVKQEKKAEKENERHRRRRSAWWQRTGKGRETPWLSKGAWVRPSWFTYAYSIPYLLRRSSSALFPRV